MDLKDIKKTLLVHKKELKGRFKLKRMGIFGSYARGEQGKKSDLDMLAEFSETPSLFELIRAQDYLSELFGVKVDLVSRGALKPRIAKGVLGEVVYV
ncbi:nucleotidyltransferase [Candidatus Micrarchaeota archaeon CG11_big_fil_rev_8_21_14_0_20_47_5]|nr:MAG: hypothetical protein AUJ17_03635 [Candidatus Micrarchaeota archaeon CG1_02_47_40]PIN84427.1 MAG: nucleotidyltransferase [Candidatus Micrarchaeota archaeon CG11_big_fil_rev_8_21_14_0_20_47_5]